MGLFNSDGDKRDTTIKKNWHKSPTVFHKGEHKLHVTGRSYILAVETPDGELVLFDEWEEVLPKIWQIVPYGRDNFRALEEQADRHMSGLPSCYLETDGSEYSTGEFTSNIAVIKMKNDEIKVEPTDTASKKLLGAIEGITITQREIGDYSSI